DRRLKRQLAHEHDSLRQQLDHDRSLRDLDEVRRLFERGASATEEATMVWIGLVDEARWVFPTKKRAAVLHQILEAREQLHSISYRFDMLGLPEAHEAVQEVADALDTSTIFSEKGLRNRAEIIKERHRAIGKGRAHLYKAAASTIGAKLPDV